MPQRFISRLLILAYLASQLAAVPHAHAESCCLEHSDHNARPHIHLPGLGHNRHSHEHDHSHDEHLHGDHPHLHEDEHCDEHMPCPSQSPATCSADCDEHDCNTVYLSYEIGSPSLLSKQSVSVTEFAALSLAMVPMVSMAWQGSPPVGFVKFADICSTDCPLYLTLRALLI